ncbi:pentatricopeptide repeat-containing protein [Carex littledalei]|uniref:Pentatricopeptide repeat-containing protein n=1 Tax=Carex littledalei TaxID=544730 RepID=A0A833RAZ1_9POAL|nr:pentatricopeptide repeat-containing protein [Carex littledalei]
MSMIIRPITQLSRSGKAANSARQALIAKATINPGIPSHAHQLFDEMPKENSSSFNRLLISYHRNNLHREALELFLQARHSERPINDSTVSSIVKSCGALSDFNLGKQFHCFCVKNGFDKFICVATSLVGIYMKCGCNDDGRKVFDLMPEKDCVAWNTMLGNLVLNGLEFEALQLFNELRENGSKPTLESYAAVIKLCANQKQLPLGRQLHSCVIKEGFESDNYVMTLLMMAYIKCMKLDQAFQVFSSMPGDARNVVSWTAIISAYAQNKDPIKVASLFSEMRRDCVEPNDFTYSTLLTTSPAISPFQIHALVIKSYYHHVPSVGTALLTAYTKLGKTRESLAIFKSIDAKDVVAWSAMLSCHAQAGDSEGAVNLFKEMVVQSVKPNEFTLSSVINATSSLDAPIDMGKQFHAMSIKYKYMNSIYVSNALVVMYAKKGSIESAQKLFDRQSNRDLVSWNSMICSYAQHGYGKRALEIFRQMEKSREKMDGVTFIGVITGCVHTGLVEEGKRYFNSMVNVWRIRPTMEHYSCMVDLYSRAGRLSQAFDLIKEMPFPADARVWRTLLGACKIHRNIELGEIAAKNLISLEPDNSAGYVLLSNMYSALGKWEESTKIRSMMDRRKVKKEAGTSWIQIRNTVHSFIASDTSHPMIDKIYEKLEEMMIQLKKEGYRPDTGLVLHNVGEEQKERMLYRHSERLALALGLICTPKGAPLQIMKNLRVCADCHTVIKMVSAIEDREIVVRDTGRFHHFNGGSCSCGDYW